MRKYSAELQNDALDLIDRYKKGESLQTNEIDFLLDILSESKLGIDLSAEDVNGLFKMRAVNILAVLNEADESENPFGNDEEKELDFLVAIYSHGWFALDADVSRVQEIFDFKVDKLMERLRNQETLEGSDVDFLITACINSKLKEKDTELINETFLLQQVNDSASLRGKRQQRKVIPYNFKIRSYEVYIGYIEDGINFKEASLYRNGKHQISVVVAIKLAINNGVHVDEEALVSSLYLCHYGSSKKLSTDPMGKEGIFYQNTMNRYCYLLDPKGLVTPPRKSRAVNWEKLDDGTIVAEFYVSAKDRPTGDIIQISAGLTTDKGEITTAAHKDSMEWTRESSVLINTLQPIDYSKVENIRLESEESDDAHMWTSYADLKPIYTKFWTTSTLAGRDDYNGWSYGTKIYVCPNNKDFKFKTKNVKNRSSVNSISFKADFINNVKPDFLYWVGGSAINTQVVFIEQKKCGIKSTFGNYEGNILYHWGARDYRFQFKNYSGSYASFDDDHLFDDSLIDGKICISAFNFYLGKSSLWADDPYLSSSKPIQIEVTDEFGNDGIVTISASANDWPALRVNGEIL